MAAFVKNLKKWFRLKPEKRSVASFVVRPKVLVADDDSISAAPLLLALAQFDVEVDYVSSGNEVVEKLRDETYKLVFLDYKMPGLTGLQTLQECERTSSFNYSTPVIFFTGFKDSLSRLDMKDFNVKEVWDKNLSFSSLKIRIKDALEAA